MLINTTTETIYANEDAAWEDMQYLLAEYGQRVCIVESGTGREVFCNRSDH